MHGLLADDGSGLVPLRHFLVLIRATGGTRTGIEDEGREVQILVAHVIEAHIFVAAQVIIYIHREIIVAAVGQHKTDGRRGFFFRFHRSALRGRNLLKDIEDASRTQGRKFHIRADAGTDNESKLMGGVADIGEAFRVFNGRTGLHGIVLQRVAAVDGIHFCLLVVRQTGNPIVDGLVQVVDGIALHLDICREVNLVTRSIEHRVPFLRVIQGVVLEHFIDVALGIILILRCQLGNINRFARGIRFGLEAFFAHLARLVQETVAKAYHFRKQDVLDMVLRVSKHRGELRTGFQGCSLHQHVILARGIRVSHRIRRRVGIIFVLVDQGDGIGHAIRQIRGITDEQVGHRAHIIFRVTCRESGTNGRGRSLGLRIRPFFRVVDVDRCRIVGYYGLDGSCTYAGKGYQFRTYVHFHHVLTILHDSSRVVGAFRKGRALFQIRIGIASGRIAQHGQQFVGACGDEVVALAHRTLCQHPVVHIKRAGPCNGGGTFFLAHRGRHIDVGRSRCQIHLIRRKGPCRHTRGICRYGFRIIGTAHRGLEADRSVLARHFVRLTVFHRVAARVVVHIFFVHRSPQCVRIALREQRQAQSIGTRFFIIERHFHRAFRAEG